MQKHLLRLSIILVSAWAASGAMAATDIVVKNDQAKLLVMPGKAGTVVVGNPNIADVTVQGSNVFVHGRNFGTTNVLVYDRDGNELGNIDVTVMMGGDHNISVFRSATRYSYVCAPECQVNHQIGDNYNWYKDMTDENKIKGALAQGSETTSSGN